MDSSISVLQKQRRHWLSIAGDYVLVGGCLVLVTWLFSSSDPLWLRLNPSPLVLVPFLMGGRYGLVPGIVSGLSTAGCGLAFAVMQDFGTWGQLLHDNRYLLAALPIAGLVAGELRSALVRSQADAAKTIADLKEAELRASSALHVAQESSHRLECQLALHGLEMVSLDNELATVLKADRDAVFREVLSVLYRIAGLHEAAIYVPSNGSGCLRRVAVLGNRTEVPESIPLDEAIVERALLTRDLVTCREIWRSTPRQSERWIAALPWVDHHGNVLALLMIRRMALLAIHWQGFDRMKTVCQWVTCCCLMRAGTAHALSEAEASTFLPAWDEDIHALRNPGDESFDRLRETARLCVRGRDLHQLPTVGLCYPGAGAMFSNGERVLRVLAGCLRPQDVCAPDPDSDSLMVLLPMLELSESQPLADRILEALQRESRAQDLGREIKGSSTQLHAGESAEEFVARLRRACG